MIALLRMNFRCASAPRQVMLMRAFTLVELLAVVAIVGILAALLLPSLSTAKMKSKKTACISNLKQLGVAFNLYCADNDGRLPDNLPENADPKSASWVTGDMRDPAQSTNQVLIRQGKLFPYASQTSIYHCPADTAATRQTLRARSFSMNGWMGSRLMETEQARTGYRTFVRDNELSAVPTSSLWLIIDEHEATIDDAWFLVTMDDSRPFASAPASRHQRGYVLNFVDGHAELYKLRTSGVELFAGQVSPGNPDWLRLKQATTVR